MRRMPHQGINEERETVEENKMEILELKSKTNEMKNSLEGL